MHRIPLSQADIQSKTFSKLSRTLGSFALSANNQGLSYWQNLLSKAFGYKDFHDARMSASINPDYNYETSDYKDKLIQNLNALGFDINIASNFIKNPKIKFIGAFNRDRACNNLRSLAVNCLTQYFGSTWDDPITHKSQKINIPYTLREIFCNTIEKFKIDFNRSTMDLKILESIKNIEDAHKYFVSEVKKFILARAKSDLIGFSHPYGPVQLVDYAKTISLKPARIVELSDDDVFFGELVDAYYKQVTNLIFNLPVSSLFLDKDYGKCLSLSDRGYETIASKADIVESYKKNRNNILSDKPLPLMEFVSLHCNLASEDSIRLEYSEYIASHAEEIESRLEDLKEEFDEELPNNMLESSKKISGGRISLKIKELDLEDSVSCLRMLSWTCEISGINGKRISAICGKIFLGLDHNVTPFDLVEACMNGDYASKSFAERYLENLYIDGEFRNFEFDNSYDVDILELLNHGPIIFIEHMERDLSAKDHKGHCFDSLEYALNKILRFMGSTICSIGINLTPYQFTSCSKESFEPSYITKTRNDAIENLSGKFDEFFSLKFVNHYNYQLVK